VVRSSLVIVTVCILALLGVSWIRFVKLDEPVESGVRSLMNGESAALLSPRVVKKLMLFWSSDWGARV